MSGKWLEEVFYVKIPRAVTASASNGESFHLCLSLSNCPPVGNRMDTGDVREILQVMQREPSSGLNNKSMSKKTPNPNPLLGYLGIFIDQKAKALQQIKLAQSHKLPATFRRP